MTSCAPVSSGPLSRSTGKGSGTSAGELVRMLRRRFTLRRVSRRLMLTLGEKEANVPVFHAPILSHGC